MSELLTTDERATPDMTVERLLKENERLKEQLRQLRKEHAEEIRDMQRESREVAAEAVWKERLGEDYGSY